MTADGRVPVIAPQDREDVACAHPSCSEPCAPSLTVCEGHAALMRAVGLEPRREAVILPLRRKDRSHA